MKNTLLVFVKKLQQNAKHPLVLINLIIIILAFTIQFVHFNEHIYQVWAWLVGQRDKPQMSAFGMWAMHRMGEVFFPTEHYLRQAKLGLEVLHLFGVGVFAIGIVALYWYVQTKKILWALIIQGFHLYEHISLTVSAIAINKSIGMSTLYGLQIDSLLLVAIRVWWHFTFNAIPTVLVVMAIYGFYAAIKQKNHAHSTLK